MKKCYLVFLTLIILSFVFTLTSCKKETNDQTTNSFTQKQINPKILSNKTDEDKTILISYTLAAFGDDWIKAAIEQFNKIYEGHGYKAVLGRSDASFTSENVITEISSPKDNNYDLYFSISENILSQLIESSYSVLKTTSKVLLADLSDILDQPAIDLYGYDESGTIRENVNDGVITYGSYTTDQDSKWYQKQYAIEWTKSIGGYVVNKNVLTKAGFDDIPYTTKEFENMIATIYSANMTSDITGDKVYPMTWAGANAPGWFAYPLLAWLAQWKGYQGFKDFYALKPETGDTITNGYDVYDDIGIKYIFDITGFTANSDYACNGTVTTIDHITSAQILADEEAAFAVSGDWIYNVLVGCDYTSEELSSIEMLPLPLLSELSDKVGLPGDNAEEKDKILSKIAKLIDERKTDSEVVSLVQSEFGKTVTLEQVQRLREARGIYFDMGTTHQCLIPSYSDNIEGAKLFLRFILSKDLSDNIYSPLANGVNANITSYSEKTNFLKSLSEISSREYCNAVGYGDKLSLIRMKGGINFVFEPYTHFVNMAKGLAYKEPSYTGEEIYKRVKKAMKDNWATIISISGLTE